MKQILHYVCLLIALFALFTQSMIMLPLRAYANATIWTDKPDYGPNDIVTIYGSGFLTNVQVTITITAPSQSMDTIYASTDDYGHFAAQYQLDGMVGTYSVTATDGPNTAMTTFKEGKIGYDLYGYTISPSPGWTKGALHGYAEDEWVQYKIEFSSSKEGSFLLTVTVRHDYYNAPWYGLDNVQDWQMWRDGVPETPTHSTPTPVGSELEWTWTFTINENDGVTLAFEAHIAIGASHWPGASIHTKIHDVTPAPPTSISQGNKDVSLPVSGIAPPPAQADIAVQKTGPQYAHEGETISYEFTVRNYGPDTASNVQVIDSKLGDLTGYLPDTTLLNGEINTFTVNHVVLTPSGDMTNTVTVSSTTGDPNSANNQASWTVDVLHPGIDVAKSGPIGAHEGDTITYTITVSNPSTDTTIYKVLVVDSLLGDISAHFSASLAPLASESKTFSYTVPTPSGDIKNTVTATYEDALGQQKTAAASWTVDVLHPSIDVTKTGPNCAHEGDVIIYTITVSNTGDCKLYGVLVTDPTLGFSWTGDINGGGTMTFPVSYTLPSPSTTVCNTVTAYGFDALGLVVSDSASWCVTVLHPAIDVMKSGPLYAHEGDTITYTITVTNIGDCPLYSVSVTDTVLGPIYSNGLAYGETKTFTVSCTVPTPSGDITNTVTASGYDAQDRKVTDTASWPVDILHPGIDVAKSGPTKAHEGDPITYAITVTNTGDCPLFAVSVTDNVLGLIYSNGLAVGETMTFTVPYTIPTPSLDITNTVTASGLDALGMSVSDSASWTVDVLHPDIDVTKTGPAYAHEGDSITYTITVSNPSKDTTMYKVSVVDSLLGDISGSFSDSLAPLASETMAFIYTVPTPSGDILNTVIATYKNGLNLPLIDDDSWTVTVLHPDISVSKSGPFYAHEGDTITYTITVSNTGDCDLSGVSVTDTLLGPIYSNGLAHGATLTFTVDHTVPTPSGDITNTVTASGSDALGMLVSDSATWFVKVQYQITVTASPPGAIGGTFKVTYTQSGVTYTDVQQTTTWTEWVDSGTTVTVSSPENPINVGPGTRYRFDHYDPSPSVTMTESKTIILVYVTQYYLTVKTFPHVLVPQPTSVPKNPPSDWYDEGTQVTLTASRTGTAYDTQYWFTWWEVYQSPVQVIRRNPITLTVSGPTTAVASYCDIDPKDPLGDANLDGKVDLLDLVMVAKRFGAVRGEASYDFACDFDRNGRIDLRDLATAAHKIET